MYIFCEHLFAEISHLFFAKENDWGFSHFVAWNVSQFVLICFNLKSLFYWTILLCAYCIVFIVLNTYNNHNDSNNNNLDHEQAIDVIGTSRFVIVSFAFLLLSSSQQPRHTNMTPPSNMMESLVL